MFVGGRKGEREGEREEKKADEAREVEVAEQEVNWTGQQRRLEAWFQREASVSVWRVTKEQKAG